MGLGPVSGTERQLLVPGSEEEEDEEEALQTPQNSARVATGTVYQVNEPPRGFTKEPLVYQVKALFLTHPSISFHKEPLSSANNLSKQFVCLLGSFSLHASWGAVLNCSWEPQTGSVWQRKVRAMGNLILKLQTYL